MYVEITETLYISQKPYTSLSRFLNPRREMFGGGSHQKKLKALEYELRLTKLKLGEMEEERDDLKNLTLELQKVLSKMTTENKIRENENDVTVNIFFLFRYM